MITLKQEKGRCIIRQLSFIFFCLFLASFLGSAADVRCETISDDKQRTIHINQPFKRIISLYGAHTENLLSLGLEKEIIGVSRNEQTKIKNLGKKTFSYHDGPEKFLAFSPDLVLIRPMIDNGYPGLIQRLEKSGITVVSLQPSGIDEVYEYWIKLGILTGKKTQAQQMVNHFKHRIHRIQQMTRNIPLKKKVYFESIHSRMKTFTPGAMPIFALETAGGINIATDAVSSRNTNIANYGKEQILAKADRIDVFITQVGVMNPITLEQIKNEPGFGIIKAVKNNQILLINENIISRPVPDLIQGVLTIGVFLYPDIFTRETIYRMNNEY